MKRLFLSSLFRTRKRQRVEDNNLILSFYFVWATLYCVHLLVSHDTWLGEMVTCLTFWLKMHLMGSRDVP